MTIRNLMLTGLTAIVLATAAGRASAGPLWTFNATFGPTIGSGWLLYQPEVFGAPAEFPPIDPQPSFQFEFPRFGVSGVNDGSKINFPVIGFTNATGAGVNHGPVPEGAPTDTKFRLTFGITDNASGESAEAEFVGQAVMQYQYNPATGQADPVQVDLRIENLSNFVWDLGGNVYRVALFDAFATGQDHLFATVDVSPETPPLPPGGTADTPEPGTLALAGLGLGAIGLLRGRRGSVRGGSTMCRVEIGKE